MPGSGKQPPEVQDQIKELLEAGFDPTTIHRRLKVGRSSIYRMKRCLQQHGTNYMPPELNKKNGRPKVLTPEQELEVLAWLRDPKNRSRYLDDLVWLIHDRFNIVCSTTTMSKMKRKWLRVIEFEENGTPIDDSTRQQLMETHPDLPILHQSAIPQAQMGAAEEDVDFGVPPEQPQMDPGAQEQYGEPPEQQQMAPEAHVGYEQQHHLESQAHGGYPAPSDQQHHIASQPHGSYPVSSEQHQVQYAVPSEQQHLQYSVSSDQQPVSYAEQQPVSYTMSPEQQHQQQQLLAQISLEQSLQHQLQQNHQHGMSADPHAHL